MKPLREDAKQARKAIHKILPADPFDAAAYDPALNTSLESGAAARAGHHAFMIKLAAVLTREQRTTLANFAGRKRWRHSRE
jgi:Spy/CpxP family protein refolding chaperone